MGMSLSERSPAALVSVGNDGDQEMRIELSVFAWRQDAEGKMQLAPTEDIASFPPMLTVKPGEESKVRLLVTTPFAEQEKNYRLIVEELPPVRRANSPGVVTMRTKFSLPVFLSPAKAVEGAKIEGPQLSRDKLSFHLRNTGNVHLRPKSVHMLALGKSGETLFEQSWDGWYLLAGDERVYAADVPKGACARIAAISVEAPMEKTTLKERLPAAPGSCDR